MNQTWEVGGGTNHYLRVLILDTMRFIDNEILEVDAFQRRPFAQNHFVRCDADVKMASRFVEHSFDNGLLKNISSVTG